MSQNLRQRRRLKQACRVLRIAPPEVHCERDLQDSPHTPTQLQDICATPRDALPLYLVIAAIWAFAITIIIVGSRFA